MKPARYLFVLLLIAIGLPCLAAGNQASVQDYDYVVNHYFWGDLYSQGGWSLYCGYKFNKDRKTGNGRVMDIGHIYPTGWLLKNVGCESRLRCYESGNQRFLRMEADLHNMYPVWYELVILRDDLEFGEIEGEQWRFDDCDYEWQSNKVEPREIARGNIARTIFYMHDTYDLPVASDMLGVLIKWNREDPPSQQEQYRNDRIEALQGRRNPYIDNPSLADRLTHNARP